ncbi:hypothetical protein LXA43DRAFT_1093322 [Ganoderma leucocontextum]|nr:hypothetical protein LXA43DRAFT_1093322 [Ganoderma leucocontextum]
MSTTEFNPVHIPNRRLLYKPRTFVVDFILGDGVLGGTRKDEDKSFPTGEQQVDEDCSPPSPHEPLEKPVVPSLGLDVASVEVSQSTDSSDSASVDMPIDPPGLPLPRPVSDATVKVDEDVLPAVGKGDTGPATTVSERPERSATPPPEPVDVFSLSGLESLRTFIPDALFPDDLLVHDPDHITNLHLRSDVLQSQSNPALRYVRIFPEVSASEGGTSQGSACTEAGLPTAPHTDDKLGTGHHSSVYSAPLRLRLNTESAEERTVRVAVKTAFTRCGAHEMLRREAVAYDAFPRHLMEDRYSAGSFKTVHRETAASSDGVVEPEMESGPDATATSISENASTEVGDILRTRSPSEAAVVPKFYGYYAAVNVDGSVIEHSHPDCDEDETCSVLWPTRILILEECGNPIVPTNQTRKQRMKCLRLVERLHHAGFAQGSMYARNILVQPGPLSVPAEERSDDTPSFRIIDFGRGQVREHLSPDKQSGFEKDCEDEEKDGGTSTLGLNVARGVRSKLYRTLCCNV